MNVRTLSISAAGRCLAALTGFALLTCCGGSSGGGSTAVTPAVSLSSTSLTFSGQFVGSTSASQSVTVTNTGNANLAFSGIAATGDFTQTNTCGTAVSPSGICTVNVTFQPTATGSRTGALTLTDNVSGSPQTVSLSGTGTSVSVSPATLTFSGVDVGQTSAAQPVTLTNSSNAALAVANIAVTTLSANFAETNNCGSSVASNASCTVNVTFTPSAAGTVNGVLTITDNAEGTAGSTQTVALTGTSSGSNSVPVSVNFGPGGFSTTANSYYNGLFTTVSVCTPGTTTCVSVPNVLVDTGSTGLRLFNSQISSLNLPQLGDSSGNGLYECLEFGSLAYTWGPVLTATVQIGGETASQVPTSAGGTANAGIPIQGIVDNGFAPLVAPCQANSIGAYNTVASLGANGILGIGNSPQDCGDSCTSANTAGNVSPYPYLLCNSNVSNCALPLVPLAAQPWNPVAAFPVDNNGVVLQLPSVPAGGATSVQGTLIFGIGTDNNNAIPSNAAIYGLDSFLDFQSLVYNGVTYTSSNSFGSFLDSGSNSLFISDTATLSAASGATITTCADNGYYCASPSPVNLSVIVSGSNGVTSPSETLSIANADTLLNSTNAALNNLAASSGGTDPSSDSWDLGIPFFLGRTVFVGIAGTNSTYPNGYWAF